MTHAFTRRRPWSSAAFLPVVAVCLLALGACSTVQSNEQSTQSVPQSDAAQSMPMSGEYPILPNGKLGRPLDWVEPTEPELPSAATDMNASGAKRFARYYLDLLAYSINTGNTKTFEQVSADECKLCQHYITTINELYESGGWADEKKYTFDSIQDPIPHPEINGIYFVKIEVTNAPYIECHNGSVISVKKNQRTIELVVKETDSSFMITHFHADGSAPEFESENEQS